jgi:hypothetical protein
MRLFGELFKYVIAALFVGAEVGFQKIGEEEQL